MTTTIGALTNVPNPGSPITSPWAQDVTRFARHVFTNAAALLAQWPAATNGSHAVLLDTGARVEMVGGTWVYVDPYTWVHTEPLAAVSQKNFTIVYGVTFTAAPVLLSMITVGSNFDLVLNWQSAPTTTQVAARIFQNLGATVTGNAVIQMVAFGRRLVT